MALAKGLVLNKTNGFSYIFSMGLKPLKVIAV